MLINYQAFMRVKDYPVAFVCALTHTQQVVTKTIYKIDILDRTNFANAGDLSTLTPTKVDFGSIFDHQ